MKKQKQTKTRSFSLCRPFLGGGAYLSQNNGVGRLLRTRAAFTLIDVLIGSSVFATIVALSLTIMTYITTSVMYVRLGDQRDTESHYLVERISKYIREGTIDYPEYYNYYVLNGGLTGMQSLGGNFGENYSVYATRFLNPGSPPGHPEEYGSNLGGLADLPSAPPADDLGTWCTTEDGDYAPISDEDCEGQPSLEYTEDIATGSNPYEGHFTTLPSQASAVCDSTSEMSIYSKRDCNFTNSTDAHMVDTLFLISKDGNTKTIIAKEPYLIGSEIHYIPSFLRMVGSDTDNDGVNDSWICAPEFTCVTSLGPNSVPDVSDLTIPKSLADIFLNFMPMVPPNLEVTDFRFYITPIEDPHKAYNEFPQKIQPKVKIMGITTLTDPGFQRVPESQRSFTFGTTISTTFYGEIESYSLSGQ